MKPHRSILSKDFVYVPSYLTDVRATFARVIAEGRQSPSKVAVTNWATWERAMKTPVIDNPPYGAVHMGNGLWVKP